MNKNYEIIDHTADIGIRVKGESLKDLFVNSALSLFELSSRRQYTRDKKHTVVCVSLNASNIEELYVNWLNELLSLSSVKQLIFHNIKIDILDDKKLEARCTGSSMVNYKVNIEIKAATYHRLKIAKVKDGWRAEVILDV